MLAEKQFWAKDMLTLVFQDRFLCRGGPSGSSQQSFTLTDFVDFLEGIEGVEYGEFDFGEILDTKRHRQVTHPLTLVYYVRQLSTIHLPSFDQIASGSECFSGACFSSLLY